MVEATSAAETAATSGDLEVRASIGQSFDGRVCGDSGRTGADTDKFEEQRDEEGEVGDGVDEEGAGEGRGGELLGDESEDGGDDGAVEAKV